jgi:hypothetical protein
MHEMRADLQRWPSITELAADLGTTNIEGLKQFIQEGSECKRAAVYANLRLVVSITKRHNRSAKVALSVRLRDCCMQVCCLVAPLPQGFFHWQGFAGILLGDPQVCPQGPLKSVLLVFLQAHTAGCC